MLGIDPDQARLIATNRSFGWPNGLRHFGDALPLAASM
jgi:hypothetical protein